MALALDSPGTEAFDDLEKRDIDDFLLDSGSRELFIHVSKAGGRSASELLWSHKPENNWSHPAPGS